MKVDKLEAALKVLLKDDSYTEVDLEYNDFKSCYSDSIQDHEKFFHPYSWVTEEDQQIAYKKHTVWNLSVHKGDRAALIKAAFCPSVLLNAVDISDPETHAQLDAMQVLFDRLLLGEHCMASFSYEIGQFYSVRDLVSRKWVERRSSVAEMAAEEMQADDWISEESMNLAFEQNEMWRIRWYPHTPIGFHDLASHSLQALVDRIEAAIASGKIETKP